MGEPETLLDWALWNASMGFRVFPLIPGEREPAIKGWKEAATTNEAVIRNWWMMAPYNIGVATGQGLAVADIDVKKGKRGFDTFNGLGWPLDTFKVHTPSGGLHVYYAAAREVRNSVQGLGEGVDIRGDGGYVVAAGSVVGEAGYQPNGHRVFLPLPDFHIDRPTAQTAAAVDQDAPAAVDRAIDFLTTARPAVEGQGGDAATFKVAATLKDFGVSEFMAWELMGEYWNPRCLPPWTPDELETKVRNAYRYGENSVGSQSPVVDFKGVDIPPAPPPAAATTLQWGFHGDAPIIDDLWLVPDIVPATGVLMIIGPPQSAKTFLIIELARCLATGKKFFGTAPDLMGASMLLFAGSEGQGIENRMAALGEPQRLPIAWAQVPPMHTKQALDAVLADLRAQAAHLEMIWGHKVRMVALETISASGMIDNENDAAAVATALRNLSFIASELGVLLVVSHHPPKTGEGGRGSGAFAGNADAIIEIFRDEGSQVREVELRKVRNGAQRKLGTFSLDSQEIGVDKRGRPVKSMTISFGAVLPTDARHFANMEVLVRSADIVDEIDTIVIDGERFVYVEAWCEAFMAVVGGSRDRSNQRKKFGQALKIAQRQGLIQRAVGPDGDVARFITFNEGDTYD